LYSTPCKNCCFAVYDGITQTGCELNKIDTYHVCSVNIIEAYDHEKEFYVIDGQCNSFRTRDWKFKNPDYLKLIQEQTKIVFNHFIYVDDSTKDEELYQSINEVGLFCTKPRKLHIILNCENQYTELKDRLTKSQIHWQIHRIFEKIEDNQRPPFDRCLYIEWKKISQCTFVSVARAGISVPKDLFAKIQIAINNKAMRVIAIDEEYKVFYSKLIHSIPNFGYVDIMKYFKDIAEENNEEFMIKKYSEL
jgi:hypothetical protein